MSFQADLDSWVPGFYRDLDTPRSLTCAILYRYGEWSQLIDLSVDPLGYLDFEADRVKCDIQATELLRKAEFLPGCSDEEREQRALESFLESEALNARTNAFLERFIHGFYPEPKTDHAIADYLDDCAKMVAQILGKFPRTLPQAGFGPGVAIGVSGHRSTIGDKMSVVPSMTPNAWTFLSLFSQTTWAEALRENGSAVEVVRGDVFRTVPKNARTFRGISVGQLLNVYYQLGVGREIRSRLQSLGLLLKNSQEHHQKVARYFSLNGEGCTIDSKAASDSVVTNLVRILFRYAPDWLDAMERLRSPVTTYSFNGEEVNHWNQKFSSMGCGFTFELETLIFYVLCKQVVGPNVHVNVYGDDIIVPTAAYRAVTLCLNRFGFRINTQKSFSTGHFRESCGGDFFNGVGVRPYYLKELPNGPESWFAVVNGLVKRARDSASGANACDSAMDHRWLTAAWRIVKAHIPRRLWLFGPEHLGDAVLHLPAPPTVKYGMVRTKCVGRKDQYGPILRVLGIKPQLKQVDVAWFSPMVRYGILLYNGDLKPLVPRGDPIGYSLHWYVV